ncbi:uncharacterized protein [Amphiura filiformis]|uniref:uncharacterized protein n=1 Tax=Amphiura filiformis TaxID=82378 RepID=UPI003B21F295
MAINSTMSAAGKSESHTLDIRVPTAADVLLHDVVKEEVSDTVTPLPPARTFDPGISSPATRSGEHTRSHSVPAVAPPYRLSRHRSAPGGTTNDGDDTHHRGPPPPPGSTILDEFSSDPEWVRDRLDQFVPVAVEPARIQLKPEIRPASIAECDPSQTAARCVNERLDNYMVIRQRSFHGLARSKKELRTLPLTDPREAPVETPASPPSWMYRSKTDLYIEKRRAKLRSQQREREKAFNLNGMTFGSLVDNLPANKDHPRKNFRNIPIGFSSSAPTMMTSYHQSRRFVEESRLPPLSLNKMKQLMKSDIETYKKSEAQTDDEMFRTSALKTPRINSRGRGKLRKPQAVASIPLRIWEPSFDYVVVSNAKMLTPRTDHNTSGTFTMERDMRQQPSQLK